MSLPANILLEDNEEVLEINLNGRQYSAVVAIYYERLDPPTGLGTKSRTSDYDLNKVFDADGYSIKPKDWHMHKEKIHSEIIHQIY